MISVKRRFLPGALANFREELPTMTNDGSAAASHAVALGVWNPPPVDIWVIETLYCTIPLAAHRRELGVDCPTPLATYPGARTGRPRTLPYLVLHRVGFTELPRSPEELVRSYRTVSPLPRSKRLLSAGRFTFCCTFLHVAATPRYGAPCPVVFGLSSGRTCHPAIV